MSFQLSLLKSHFKERTEKEKYNLQAPVRGRHKYIKIRQKD